MGDLESLMEKVTELKLDDNEELVKKLKQVSEILENKTGWRTSKTETSLQGVYPTRNQLTGCLPNQKPAYRVSTQPETSLQGVYPTRNQLTGYLPNQKPAYRVSTQPEASLQGVYPTRNQLTGCLPNQKPAYRVSTQPETSPMAFIAHRAF